MTSFVFSFLKKTMLSLPCRITSNAACSQAMCCAPCAPAAGPAGAAAAGGAPSHLLAVACGPGAAVYGVRAEDGAEDGAEAPELVHLVRATPSQHLVVCSGVLFRAPPPATAAAAAAPASAEGALLAVATVNLDDTPPSGTGVQVTWPPARSM